MNGDIPDAKEGRRKYISPRRDVPQGVDINVLTLVIHIRHMQYKIKTHIITMYNVHGRKEGRRNTDKDVKHGTMSMVMRKLNMGNTEETNTATVLRHDHATMPNFSHDGHYVLLNVSNLNIE